MANNHATTPSHLSPRTQQHSEPNPCGASIGACNRRQFLAGLLGATALGALGAHASQASAAAQTPSQSLPNIVWIWSDNLAYGDLSCYGNTEIETPVVDQLASEGVRFTQYYIAHAVCSPSRAGLLTGRQPYRAGIIDVLRPDGPSGLPEDEITLAEMLGQQGYATACIGKWHLGDQHEFLPLQHGFDHYFGLPYSMDMLPTVLYRDNEIIERLSGDKVRDVTERMIDDGIDFVEQHQSKPFFLYFNHTLPHPPINLPEGVQKEGQSAYQAALEHMDAETGRLLDALDALGLRDNTLVVFTSDNGPMLEDGNTAGLRGRISVAYEGGVRVPFIARWPGKIPAGRTVDTPAIAYDIFPTLAHITGQELPDDRVYDGRDIMSLLTGEGSFERDDPFVWVHHDRVAAVRDGKWKFHTVSRGRAIDPPELYDLEADPAESAPVNEEHPEVVERLKAFVAVYEADLPKVWNLNYPVRASSKRPSGVRRE